MARDSGAPLLWRARRKIQNVFVAVAFAVIALGLLALVLGLVHGSLQEISTALVLLVGGALILVWKRR